MVVEARRFLLHPDQAPIALLVVTGTAAMDADGAVPAGRNAMESHLKRTFRLKIGGREHPDSLEHLHEQTWSLERVELCASR